MLALMTEELAELRAKYATPRRTLLGEERQDFTDAELITEESAVIITTADGYIKRLPLDALSAQRRGTRGKAGMSNLHADDEVGPARSDSGRTSPQPHAATRRSGGPPALPSGRPTGT